MPPLRRRAGERGQPARAQALRTGSDETRGWRVLLVDDLDAAGAERSDVLERVACLESSGARVEWVALAPDDVMPARDDLGASRVLPRTADSLQRVRALVAAGRFDLVIVGSGAEGGGPVAQALPPDVPARWWPTAIGDGPEPALSRLGRGLLGRPGLPPLDGHRVPSPQRRVAYAAVSDHARGRGALPLWDGDFVVAVDGLGGAPGRRLLRAFSSVAEGWSGFDLVAWSHPDSESTRRSEALGIGLRVHPVGPPRRLAEWAWWGQASAAVLTGGERLATGRLLRGLASGCPLLWVAPDPARAGVAQWLEREGCAFVTGADPEAIGSALERLLRGGPDIERAVRRGQELARAHDALALAARLGACWTSAPARPRAA